MVIALAVAAIAIVVFLYLNTVKEGFESPVNGFPEGYFYLMNVDGDALDGIDLSISKFNKSANSQQWYIDALGRLKNRYDNSCIGLNGNQLVKQECNADKSDNQRWSLRDGKLTHEKTNRVINKNLSFAKENGPTDAWNAQKFGKPIHIVQLAEYIDGKTNKEGLTIPSSRLLPSNNFTYRFRYKMTHPEQDIIMGQIRKGTDKIQGSPSITILPSRVIISISTSVSSTETCEFRHVFQKDKWYQIAIQHETANRDSGSGYDGLIRLVVDGELVGQCSINGVINPNNAPVRIGQGGFGGLLANVEYANYITETYDSKANSEHLERIAQKELEKCQAQFSGSSSEGTSVNEATNGSNSSNNQTGGGLASFIFGDSEENYGDNNGNNGVRDNGVRDNGNSGSNTNGEQRYSIEDHVDFQKAFARTDIKKHPDYHLYIKREDCRAKAKELVKNKVNKDDYIKAMKAKNAQIADLESMSKKKLEEMKEVYNQQLAKNKKDTKARLADIKQYKDFDKYILKSEAAKHYKTVNYVNSTKSKMGAECLRHFVN